MKERNLKQKKAGNLKKRNDFREGTCNLTF